MRSNKIVRLELAPFETHCSLKAQAKKVLEEAAELFNEAEIRTKHPDLESHVSWLEDEAADVIMATVNLVWLAWRKEEGEFGIADLEDTMAWAMERCRQKNEDRGKVPAMIVHNVEGLKPCPFCGSPAELVTNSSGDDFVRCTNKTCAARTRLHHENVNGPVMQWNARVGDQSAGR